MTLLSRKADYALLILSFLHSKGGSGNAREIAEKFDLSRPFVANILKELCQKGFVASHRGVKGGYALAKPASEISLADLLESIEDGFRLTLCNPDDQDHPGDCSMSGTCSLRHAMTEVHRRLIDVLRGVKLDELFGNTLQVSPSLLPLSLVHGSPQKHGTRNAGCGAEECSEFGVPVTEFALVAQTQE